MVGDNECTDEAFTNEETNDSFFEAVDLLVERFYGKDYGFAASVTTKTLESGDKDALRGGTLHPNIVEHINRQTMGGGIFQMLSDFGQCCIKREVEENISPKVKELMDNMDAKLNLEIMDEDNKELLADALHIIREMNDIIHRQNKRENDM